MKYSRVVDVESGDDVATGCGFRDGDCLGQVEDLWPRVQVLTQGHQQVEVEIETFIRE